MLGAALSGEDYSKAEHNRRLRRRIDRSRQSVEFRHANISAVLLNLGDLPYIDGCKPRSNYQQLVERLVLERLAIEPDFFERLTTSPVRREVVTVPLDGQARFAQQPRELQTEISIREKDNAQAARS